ncbi:protein kinase [Blastocystis sp. ATCC 50177/Nand II]|uniref:Protein kinase n=1 Tax=Blastocystis sp. subtype 1 (strain ATCC 50177 / NandII) TaxID=478820 RepID=A0A196S717_BLAHN|nr:protein kinase [Blastocystis sp. ATCC 50177/Nand II]
MGAECSSMPQESSKTFNESDLKTLKMEFNALAHNRSDEGYILKEDFLHFFNLPGLLAERLFVLFDSNHDEKIYWPEFQKGIERCICGDEKELDEFIYNFFRLNNHRHIECEEFQSIMQHLPPSVFFVVMKNADTRDAEAQKWVSRYGYQMNDLPVAAIQEGISILIQAYFRNNDDDESTSISYHDFSVFLREQPNFRDYFRTIMVFANPAGNTPTPASSVYLSTTQPTYTPASDSYNTMPFDIVDPEVYRSRHERSIAKLGHPEKWQGYARAYWCIVCNYCHKEVRFCCMCQGELKPVEKAANDGVCRLQCTECHRVVTMRFCSACGHQFEPKVVDARMEIPGVNTEVKEYSGELFQVARFNSLARCFARIHNNFLYVFNTPSAETPSDVCFLEKATVRKNNGDPKSSRHFGFVIQFPAAYDKEFFCATEEEQSQWMKAITDVSGVRRIEDYYDIREKIGEGRFAEVYRCVNKKTGKDYAVKVINKTKLTEVSVGACDETQKESELIHTEIAILSLVQHKNIVMLMETFETATAMYIVMELLRGGELYTNICGRAILTEEEAFRIIYPLTECLAYLHSMGIIHRDIKVGVSEWCERQPENILCNKNLFDVKIGDFGFSKLVFPKEKLDYPCGTLNYIAPEVISKQGYTTKADMWSLGIIFYLLLRGRLPFDGQSKREVIEQVTKKTPDYNNKAFLRLSENCRNAIQGLLQKDPDMRLSAEDLLHHPWFDDMKAKLKEEESQELAAEVNGVVLEEMKSEEVKEEEKSEESVKEEEKSEESVKEEEKKSEESVKEEEESEESVKEEEKSEEVKEEEKSTEEAKEEKSTEEAKEEKNNTEEEEKGTTKENKEQKQEEKDKRTEENRVQNTANSQSPAQTES